MNTILNLSNTFYMQFNNYFPLSWRRYCPFPGPKSTLLFFVLCSSYFSGHNFACTSRVVLRKAPGRYNYDLFFIWLSKKTENLNQLNAESTHLFIFVLSVDLVSLIQIVSHISWVMWRCSILLEHQLLFSVCTVTQGSSKWPKVNGRCAINPRPRVW